MIALTAFHGNRRRELVEMQAARNLLRVTDGYMLLLDKSNTKNKKSDRIRLNPLLTAAFDEYLAVHRPALVDGLFAFGGKTCKALFVSARCGQLPDTRVSTIFSQWTKKLLGSAWSPHAFRRAITTDAVKRDPKLVACAAAVNRHSMKVAHAHYDMAKVSAAERRFAEIFRLAST